MPIKGRTKQDVLLEFRRSEILEAARKVCAVRGYHDMTVDEIAQAAGMAKGTVYLYFRSKLEIYWAMLDSILGLLHEQVREELGKPGTIEDCLRRFVATKMAYFEAHHDLLRLYYHEVNSVAARPPRSRDQFDRRYLEQVRLLQAALETAVTSGVLPQMRCDMAALTIFEVTRSAVMHRSRGWSKASLDEDIAFTFGFIWKGLSGS
jgi:AcrR family transcriptional regulator